MLDLKPPLTPPWKGGERITATFPGNKKNSRLKSPVSNLLSQI
jgi:hypothetical protein